MICTWYTSRMRSLCSSPQINELFTRDRQTAITVDFAQYILTLKLKLGYARWYYDVMEAYTQPSKTPTLAEEAASLA
jgi:hypothetical protein